MQDVIKQDDDVIIINIIILILSVFYMRRSLQRCSVQTSDHIKVSCMVQNLYVEVVRWLYFCQTWTNTRKIELVFRLWSVLSTPVHLALDTGACKREDATCN